MMAYVPAGDSYWLWYAALETGESWSVTETLDIKISLLAACTRLLYVCCFLCVDVEESGLGGGVVAQFSHFVHAASFGFLLLPLVPAF